MSQTSEIKASIAFIRKYNFNKRKQIGGNHYKKYIIEPIDFITANNIPYIEGNVIKYLVRWKDKNGIEDLDKAIHYIELLKEIYVKGVCDNKEITKGQS